MVGIKGITMERLDQAIRDYIKALRDYEASGDSHGKMLCPALKRKMDYRYSKMQKISNDLGLTLMERLKKVQELS